MAHPAADDWKEFLPDTLRRTALITYHLETPPRTLKDFLSRYSPEQLELLEKLNRSDVGHLPRLKEVVVPDRWDLPEVAYSPLPPGYALAEPHAKMLVVDLAGQVFGGYEHGRLVRWGPISSGAAGAPTAAGYYHLNWKSAGRPSKVNPEWFMRRYYSFAN